MNIPNNYRRISVALTAALVAAGGIRLALSSSHAMSPSPAIGAGSQKTEAVVLSPNRGALTEFSNVEQPIRVSFATVMVPLEKVRRGGQPSPITFEPLVETRWIWVSQTEGKLTFPQQFVVDNIPGTVSQSARLGSILHRARLRSGLQDLAGKPIAPGTWGIEFSDNKFALKTWEFLNDNVVGEVETDEAESENSHTKDETPIAESEEAQAESYRGLDHPLPPRPRIRLEFSRDVPLADVLKAVYFQDSKTKERLPVEVNLEERQALGAQGWVLVEPVQPLPVGCTYLLVIEPLKEASGEQTLPNLRVLIAGTSYPLRVQNAAPLNQPLKGAFIRVALNQPIDPDPANLKQITVEPGIDNLHFEIDRNGLEVMGNFNPSTEYRVRFRKGLRSRGGYALSEDSTWKAHFRAKRPAIVLPEEIIFQRASAPSLRCSFVQINTQELQWKLARLPREKFVVVNERLREFRNTASNRQGGTATDPQTGEYLYQGTSLLIPTLALQVVASGRIDASRNDAETPRVIEWHASDRQPGVYLLEISGRDLRGRAVGNRVIVSRGDWMVTVVESKAEEDIIRVANMSDGQPARGVAVELLETSGPIAAFRTDSNGEILFGPSLKDRKGRVIHPTLATAIVVGEPGRECLQFPDLTKFRARNIMPLAEGRWVAGGDQSLACVIITDRNVYRAGEIVKFKGFVRAIGGPSLSIPANKPVRWTISGSAPDSSEESVQSLYEGDGFVSSLGDWEGEWTVPASAFGEYFISALNCTVKVTVAEFRPPAFSVAVESKDTQGETVTAKITSQHFHGAPNAGAKVHWKTEWVLDDWRRASPLAEDVALNRRDAKHIAKVLSDKYSPDSPTQGFSDDIMGMLKDEGWATARLDREVSVTASREGDVILDANGVATVECKSPFPADRNVGRAKVYWLVDVTSGSAVTHRGGTVARVQFVPQILGVSLESRGYHKALVEVASFDADDNAGAGILARAELFRVEIKTVKEEISRGLNRYRNYPIFERVWQADVTTPSSQIVHVEKTGNYVLRVIAPSQPHTPQVSDTEMIAGWGNADVAIEDESSIVCKPDRERYTVGDTASIAVQTPFGGVATVTVETDRILYRQTVQLSGNAQRISVPIQSTFAPNAYVCVHIIKPAEADGLPGERFGVCEIKVDRPDQHLEVKPVLASDVFEPGAMISGIVKVSNQDRPVPGADLMLFAVDEAVLQLGRWKLPDFDETFFPRRAWEVETHCALGLLWTPEKPESLDHSQKGFIIGDGGPLLPEASVRKDFAPLAFWNAKIGTNAAGEAPFRFKAPDGLTSYRIVAVAQRGADQFGNGQKIVRLTKKLQIEPILPDFLRQNDELYLRLLVRQDHKDEDTIDVTLAPDPGLEPLESLQKSVTVKRGEPSLASFHVKVAGQAPRAKIDLAARSTGTGNISDHVRNTLTIYPSVLERRQTLFGQITRTQPLNITTAIPPAWLSTTGVCDVMLSGSTYLPKIAGLPAMLEIHGSVEKISTQILAATLLAETLDYVPFASEKSWRARTEAALKKLAPAVLDSGGLSVWPSGGKLNGFATVEAAWAILLAKKQGLSVDEKLVRNADRWLDNIVRQEFGFNDVAPDIRCFALMVLGHTRDRAVKKEGNYGSEAEELFNNRQELTDEGRAWLALGSWYLEIKLDTVNTLLREIDHPLQAADFDPEKFGSSTRAEALCLLAQSEIQATNWPAPVRERVRRQFERITQSSVDLSTQENLWLMLLFNSLTRGEIPARIQRAVRTFSPKPPVFSKNETSVGWSEVPLNKLQEFFPRPLQLDVDGSYLVRAVYEVPASELPAHAPSLNIERIIRNLTSDTRTGTQSAPFKLGDQILVTYRMNADKPHSYVEIEDQLPACLETINPKLPLIAKYFQLPIEAGVNTLPLSHVELRFARTMLYFDKVLPGQNAYSVLARVTNAGAFHWPGTQVRPLYDSRFSDTSNQMLVYTVE